MTRAGSRATCLLAAAAVLLGACSRVQGDPTADSSDSTITVAAFEEMVAEREQLPPEEAACVARSVFEHYDDQAVADLYEGGLSGLGMGDWNAYGHAVIACSLADDLGVPLPTGPSHGRTRS
jgi:hypothetical protein